MSFTHPGAWQWNATADQLINTRKWYTINGHPVPVRKTDGSQTGYYPTIADKENDRNYVRFYNRHGGAINKFGKKEYWSLKPEFVRLQQQISDKFHIITFKPDDEENQSKNKSGNRKISTRPTHSIGLTDDDLEKRIQNPVPITGMAEYEEKLRIDAGGKIPEVMIPIDTSGDAYQQTFFPVIPEAAAAEESPSILSANIQITFTDSSIGGFSTSIDAKDIGKFQGIMNDRYSNKAKYTLIGSSTNPPLKTMNQVLNDIESLLSRPAPPAAAEPGPEITVIPEAAAEPEPTTNKTITNNMITQRIDHFTIQNGRAKGQITFTLNDNFNPFYYGKNITNIITFKTKAGVNILPFIKQNTLRFTATERDEIIQYNEDMKGNTIADLESFVWSSPTNPTAFSSVLRSEIKEGEEAITSKDGFMAMGITGAIALLIGIGLILPDRMRRKK